MSCKGEGVRPCCEAADSFVRGAPTLHYGEQAAEYAAKLSTIQVLEAVVDGIVCNARVGQITDPAHHVRRFHDTKDNVGALEARAYTRPPVSST